MRGEDAVVDEQVHGGAGDEGREPLHELDRLEQQLRGAIAPHRLELDEDAAVGAADAVLGERGAEEIAAELFEAGAIVGGNPDVGVEVEALGLGLARAAGGDVTEVRLLAEAAEAGAGAGAESDAALDGGADDPGQDGRGLAEGVGRRAGVGWLELATGEQPSDTGADGGEELCHVLIARCGRRVKGEVAGLRLAEDAVEYKRVVVEVELEAAAEALDHGDRPGLAVVDSVGAGGARVEGEEHASIDAQHRAAQGMIPRQAVAQAIRERQHSLAHRHPWQHLVDEKGGAFGHAAPATARTEAAPLAAEREQMLERTVRAPKPREPVARDPTPKVCLELTLNEPRQPRAFAIPARLSEERWEVRLDGPVEHRVLGLAALVRCPPMAPGPHGPAGEHGPCLAEMSRRIVAGTSTCRILLRLV
jgi:hypothetical protein